MAARRASRRPVDWILTTRLPTSRVAAFCSTCSTIWFATPPDSPGFSLMELIAPPRAVVFDMDGLLLDSERICMEIFADVCTQHGFAFDRGVYARCIGTNREGTRRVLLEGYGAEFPYEVIEHDWMRRYEARVLAEPVPVKAGAFAVLECLDERKIDIALATSTYAPIAARKLELAGLDGYFEIRVTGDQVSRGKPDPEPYLEALRRLGHAADGCWALEDSDNGVKAAHGAGMMVVQVPDLIEPSAEVRALGHPVVDSLLDVLALLGEHKSKC
ncbi:MAG: HAD family phosphatase [Gammaproteobacteria bacterium]|nr:MAG: HAD family phosphatase [Gammaproteobacteria bacterium]